jgi:hypothetical protein
MDIKHILVHIMTREVIAIHNIKAELEIHFTNEWIVSGFKYTPEGWILPKYYSYRSGKQEIAPVFSKTPFINERLTAALTSVKIVLTSESYGRSYLVNSKGATLIAQ